MGHRYAEIAFTETIKDLQRQEGSRKSYDVMEVGPDSRHKLTEKEVSFIQHRDSFYMASVGETGWPYVQHRGGPKGFMQVIDETTIGFADYSGNRQYISRGNFVNNNRVSLFFMDYPNQRRLKMMGRVTVIGPDDLRLAALMRPGDGANIERGILIKLEAFDWNCPQHITPRFDTEMVKQLVSPLKEENRNLKEAMRQQNQGPQAESWGDGPLVLIITGLRQVTPSIRAYELRAADGTDLPEVSAGAHLQIPVMIEDALQWRHYSISSDPGRRDQYEIAVKKEAQGSGGSLAIHQYFHLGMTLHCRLPENHFSLAANEVPILLIAGGIGITPIKAMAHTLLSQGRSFELHYAVQNMRELAFAAELRRAFGERVYFKIKEEGDPINLQHLLSHAKPLTQVYVCGPARLIDGVLEVGRALAWTKDRIAYERFEAGIAEDAQPVELYLRQSQKKISVAADESLLDAMLRGGVAAQFSCKTGNCKTCAVKVLAGTPDHRDHALTTAEQTQEGLMCPCVSRAKSTSLTLDL